MCGESMALSISSIAIVGSPPHVWGKPYSNAGNNYDYRITPTCVGKAHLEELPEPATWDHPHMCGESLLGLLLPPERPGSPPHVWGKLAGAVVHNYKLRITPTCVGKASESTRKSFPAKDHPHMCGESPMTPASTSESMGSPPHVWGKLIILFQIIKDRRITPTCVGKAPYEELIHIRRQDHPHMCGESVMVPVAQGKQTGSPPHVWGKLMENCPLAEESRITPTCVGKASRRRTEIR